MTVGDALREAAARLAAADIDTADLDAELLLRHVLGWDRARVLASPREPLPETAAAEYAALVEQRASRRPLQHLTGTQAFWKHEFVVSPDVLIPRPETELLVEMGLDLLRDVPEPSVVDVGTGSGCIAISLALERPDGRVWALDISPAALDVAAENARRLGAAARVRLVRSDLLDGVAELSGTIDLIVSNPPYVDPAEIPALMPEVRDHEPRVALHSPEGRDALYRRLATQAAAMLRPGGALAVEIGRGMEDGVRRIVTESGLVSTDIRSDLAGISRVVIAKKRPTSSNA